MVLHFMSIFLQKFIVRKGFSLLTTKEKNGAIAKLHSGSKFMFSGCDLKHPLNVLRRYSG